MSSIPAKTQDIFLLTPTNLEEAMKYAELIASSSLVPQNFKNKPGDVLVAVQMGVELGLKPMQALQNISVINGRAALWGDAMLAVVKNHPDFEWIEERQNDGKAQCKIKRKNHPEHTVIFTMDDAKRAGLVNKSVWGQYPKRMLQMRARSFALRDTFPDALRGLYSVEEAQDIEEIKELPVIPAEKKLGLAGLEAVLDETYDQQSTQDGQA